MEVNYILKTIKAENCNEYNIYFYKDKTIEVTDFTCKKNIKYINLEIMRKIIETIEELGWIR